MGNSHHTGQYIRGQQFFTFSKFITERQLGNGIRKVLLKILWGGYKKLYLSFISPNMLSRKIKPKFNIHCYLKLVFSLAHSVKKKKGGTGN